MKMKNQNNKSSKQSHTMYTVNASGNMYRNMNKELKWTDGKQNVSLILK